MAFSALCLQVLLWASGSSYLLFEWISVLLCCCLPSGVIIYPSLLMPLGQLSFSRTEKRVLSVSSMLLTFVVFQFFFNMVLFNSVLNCNIMLSYLREPHMDNTNSSGGRSNFLMKLHLLVSFNQRTTWQKQHLCSRDNQKSRKKITNSTLELTLQKAYHWSSFCRSRAKIL